MLHGLQNATLSSSWLSKNLKIKLHRTVILPVFFCMGVKLGGSYEGGTQAEGV